MTYSILVLFGIGASVGLDLALLRTNLLRRTAFWVSYGILFCFQLLVNGILTGTGIVRYDPAIIVGFRIAYAPVEDLGFGFALILSSLCCWVALGRRANLRR